MTFQLPPIVKAAERLCVEIEEAVRRFVRYHRYVIGTDLRRQAMHVYGLAERAWRDQAQQARLVIDLVWAIDELQRYLQVAKLLKATASFRQFEHLLRLIEALGKQAGGWRKKLHPNGQNARGSDAFVQRAETLLTSRPEPAQANPTAAQSAVGIGIPCSEAHQRPSEDAGAFFGPAGMGQLALWRAVCGGRETRRPSDRYANRAPSATSIGIVVADLTSEDCRMQTANIAQATREDRAIRKALHIIEKRWSEPTIGLDSPGYAINFFNLRLSGLDREVFECAFMDSKNRLIAVERLFLGSICSAEVHPREIAKRSLELNAAAVIISHNHPSGDLVPSAADRSITRAITNALALIDVRLVDHVLVARGRAISFAERSLL